MIKNRNKARKIKHKRIRKKISGSAEIPRVCLFKSLKNLEAQLINDVTHKTLSCSSTRNLKLKNGSNIEAAKKVGEDLFEKLKKLKIKKMVFDRSGYIYHGRVKAFVETLRQKGMKF